MHAEKLLILSEPLLCAGSSQFFITKYPDIFFGPIIIFKRVGAVKIISWIDGSRNFKVGECGTIVDTPPYRAGLPAKIIIAITKITLCAYFIIADLGLFL